MNEDDNPVNPPFVDEEDFAQYENPKEAIAIIVSIWYIGNMNTAIGINEISAFYCCGL